MSELVTTRIRDAAGRLHLANLGENLEALVARAEGGTMGYLEFWTWCWRRRPASARADGSATP